MTQWFRGHFEADYVGTPAAPRVPMRPNAALFGLRLLRASVHDVELLDEAPTPDEAEDVIFQAELTTAVVRGVRGRGSRFEGPLFELQLSQIEPIASTRQGTRTYGRLRGRLVARCELPPPTPPVAQTAGEDEQTKGGADGDDAETNGRLIFGEVEEGEDEARLSTQASEALGSGEPSAARPDAARGRSAPRHERTTPLFALTAAVAGGLWLRCGAAAALLFLGFLVPTLAARSLFRDVLRDSTGLRALGFLLVLIQVTSSAVLLSEWWGHDCRALDLVPLIGVVAVLFPSGILPSLVPLACNAAGLALVLFTWCGGGSCDERVMPGVHDVPPSVEHPGVPRTNDDGSWPRRPPG